MLIVTEEVAERRFKDAREGLIKHYNEEMEKILNANSAVDKYWILGKTRFPEELGGGVGRTFLQACMERPGLVASSFVYEVDNRQGVKTLLWVIHPDGTMRLPTLNKTISVAGKQDGRKKTK